MFWTLFGQNKQFKDVTYVLGNSDGHFPRAQQIYNVGLSQM